MSISSSFRLFPSKVPSFLHPHIPITKTLISSPPNLSKPSFFSSISIEKLPSKPCFSCPSSSSVTSASLQSIDDLPPKLQEIVKLFQSVEEPKAKYEQLLYYGRNLTPLDSKFKTQENKVKGCVSQVWVRAYLDSGNNVRYEADSDSVLTKGLAALLVQGLSGRPVSDILKVSPDFVTLIGLQQSLTPSRNNGFLNMLKLMQNKAFLLYKEAEDGSGYVDNGVLEDENEVGGSNLGEIGVSDLKNLSLREESEVGTNELKIRTDERATLGSRGERIREILERELGAAELEVEDISHQHAGHAGVRGSDGETHFNVRIVSKEFEGKSMVKQHRLVYDLLKNELESGLHALSIVAKTPSEVNGR